MFQSYRYAVHVSVNIGAMEINPVPQSLLFLDDIRENVEGALNAGWNAFQFNGCEDCISKFKEYGIY